MSHQLCSAAERGDLEKVRELLDAGIDVDWHSKSRGMTALWEAVSGGHPDVVRLLIERGADVDHAPPVNGMTPLLMACIRSQAPLVELLLQAGADPNKGTTDWNITPLMTAAQAGQVEIVRRLLAAGANGSAVTKDGRTALSLAEKQNHLEVVILLRRIGAPAAIRLPEPIPIPWPAVLEGRTKEATPEAVLFGFINAMNRWEREAARLFKANNENFTEEVLQALQNLFVEFCTPRPRPYGRNGSFQTPPEYDPQQEILVEIRSETTRRTILLTRNPRSTWEYRYVLLKQGGRWLLDSKKVRSIGGEEGDWGDWSL